MKKVLMMVLTVAIVAAMLAGCATMEDPVAETESVAAKTAQASEVAEDTQEASTEEAHKFKVGVSILDSSNTLYVDVIQGIKDMLPEDAEVTVADCQNNVATQAEDVENLTAAGVDGIVILPAEPNALEAAIKAAREKGVYVISIFDELIEYDSYIAFDPYTYGKLLGEEAGKWIAENLDGQAEVGMLTYNTMPAVITRQEGMVDGMHEYAPDAEVVAQQDAAAPDEGLAVTESFLQAYPDMKVVMGINDGGAIGAYQAYVSANKADEDVFVGGTDGLPQAYELMGEEGSIYRASVDAHPHEMGAMCAKQLMLMVLGKDYEKTPEVELSVVTQENLADKLEELVYIEENGRTMYEDERNEILG